MQKAVHVALAALFLTGANAVPALADDCSDLASFSLPETEITRAETVGAGAFKPPESPFGPPPGVGQQSFGNMPAFCRVSATLTPTADSDIRVEVWMPAENWNGKLVGIGNGVWAGAINFSQMANPLTRGYAVAATDTGHVGSGMSAEFAVGHPEKLVDFGHRAVHEMTVTAKAVIETFYGEAARHSLWTSCSTGGRQGLMETYRYPEDYDGISAMAPANPMTQLMVQSIWTGYAALKSSESNLSRSELAAVHEAYLDACDAEDGVEDRLVSHPEQCEFEPKTVQCKNGNDTGCLSAAQVETMRAVYGGVVNPSTGETVFPGFQPGSEAQLGLLMAGPEPFPVATSYMRHLVFEDPDWDFRTFDYGADIEKAQKAWGDVLDVPSDGLDAFFAKGGKLLLSHGWNDGLIPATNTVAFYNALLKDLDEESVADALRLFMVPGMGHCSGGEGPFLFDVLSIIDDWVTTGNTPDRIVARRPADVPSSGSPAMSRPLCPYPQVAEYTGSGSTNEAANFVCRAPDEN